MCSRQHCPAQRGSASPHGSMRSRQPCAVGHHLQPCVSVWMPSGHHLSTSPTFLLFTLFVVLVVHFLPRSVGTRTAMVRLTTDDDIGLRVLRDAPADAAEPVDIVAVHGIGAHPEDSWCKNVGTAESPRWVNWLVEQSMLPAVAPQARIMRYGYQSQWFGEGAMRQKASTVAQRLLLALRRRRAYPFRPLLFVAHCFGGLVVLKALLDARHHESEWPGVFASTTGLIFFGTPFRGAEGMSQVEMLAAAQREYEQDEIQADTLGILQPGNEFLQEVVDQFGKTRGLANKAQVACFYELKTSNVGRIVGKIDRTVSSGQRECAVLSALTVFVAIRGERELWLPRPV
ncbi:hypothetical protein BU25DRAFT_243492 [Macroventuria anomochaeta]|uniref:Uncharacterized protein n=1 Tax=Macroventuria anomochaeta TaxID=301207 RepID=A0ACB6S8M1_9PLEO|nr:uncharacterized protein BU25DRAFT_243492 [Macroventuria anomochaeta]KAF2630605.1 hypothetical protein BU25DRAFT_243492 [Macroventuria anomochaeta]